MSAARPSADHPTLCLVRELESAALVLPRARPEEAETLLASLAGRIDGIGRGGEITPALAERARRALAGFAAAVAVMRASNEARLSALLNAARPAAGYNGAGQFSRPADFSIRGSA